MFDLRFRHFFVRLDFFPSEGEHQKCLLFLTAVIIKLKHLHRSLWGSRSGASRHNKERNVEKTLCHMIARVRFFYYIYTVVGRNNIAFRGMNAGVKCLAEMLKRFVL